jgi:P-type Ca2+ transporter type 2C
MAEFHAQTEKELLSGLKSSRKGLSEKEAEQRLLEGRNELEAKKSISALGIVAEQFKDFLILLLIAAAIISIGIGLAHGSLDEMFEAVLILVIVAFIVAVGFYQEYHAEKELDALKSMMNPHARVVRDGELRDIDAKFLVPGDVVVIEEGDRIPADLRILECSELKSDESSLTGESEAVEKSVGVMRGNTALGDRSNMLYMGTSAVSGRCTALVAATGMKTELGKIAGELSGIKKEETPLQKRLNTLGKQIGMWVLLLCGIVLAVGVFFSGTPFQEMLIVAIALAVAAVPEGLPGVVTVALASGIRRMVSEHALIRKLPAVETLGSTTVICSDKTGTLTKNEMTVRKLWTLGGEYSVEGEGYGIKGKIKGDDAGHLDKMLECAALVCDASVGKKGISGDPTEAAVVVLAGKGGVFADKIKKSLVNEIPFSSERKRKTKTFVINGKKISFSMGAPDVLIGYCSKALVGAGEKAMSEKLRDEILSANSGLAAKAYRVLALARKQGEGESGMTFLGLVAMIDPPRSESKRAVAECKDAGIRVVMITGDHKLTARAIAGELGIYKEGDLVLTGEELEGMNDADLKKAVSKASVYARVSPLHKLRIVSALQANGEVVAMTGDGVNDAPALKKADIGVAMGISGTDVSREASDMVLTDDNFASIVKAVEEGRGIYDNIRKFFAYLISGNIGEVAVVFLSSMIPGVPLALSATQILIINLVTDGLPALALGVDPFEPGAMKRKPRPKKEPLHRNLKPFIIWYPILMTIVTMALFLWAWESTQDVFQAQTVAFLSIAFFEMYQAFASRSIRYPALKVGLFKNKYLVAAVGFSLAFLLVLVYVPIDLGEGVSLQEMAHVSPLEPGLLLIIVALSSIGFIYLELSKWKSSRKEGCFA